MIYTYMRSSCKRAGLAGRPRVLYTDDHHNCYMILLLFRRTVPGLLEALVPL